jgi:hypothetical protein
VVRVHSPDQGGKMVKYNSESINVTDLVALLEILPRDSTIFVNKLFQLAWLPVDEDNPGGVIEFDQNCLNPHGVLVKHYKGGDVIIHGPNAD